MSETNRKLWSESVIEFFLVCTFSIVVGVGIGTIQGYFSFFLTDALPEVLWETASLGLATGLLVGPGIHYGVLKRKTTFAAATRIIAASALVGAVTGLALNRLTHGEGGWLSIFFTLVASVLISIWQRRSVGHQGVAGL